MTLSAQPIDQAGITPVLSPASIAGDTFVHKANRFILVRNASGASITVTVDSLVNCNQGFDHDLVVTVADATEKLIGPFNTRFVSPQGGISMAYSATTGVSVALLEL